MDVIEQLQAGIAHIDHVVAEWEPNPDGEGWLAQKDAARSLREEFELGVEAHVEDAAEYVTPETMEAIERRVAELAGEVSVYLHLSGDARGYQEMLGRGLALDDPEARAVFEAGKRNPDAYTRLVYGRWLHHDRRYGDAKRVLKGLSSAEPAIAGAAAEALEMPRPLTSVPSLWRINGFGQALYGRRDAYPDGSYVATLCICALFIPLIPIRAYRLWDEGDSYSFHSIVPLSPFARWARRLVLAGAAVAMVSAGLSGHFGSPEYAMKGELEEAKALEEAGDREAAAAAYRSIIDTRGETLDVSDAALGVMRVAVSTVPSPCDAAAVAAVGRVVNTFYELPLDDRAEAEKMLVERLLAWAGEIGQDDAQKARASVSVLKMAEPLDEGATKAPVAKAQEALGDHLRESRPLMALAAYTEVASLSADTTAKALAVVETFDASPSLWMEAEARITLLARLGRGHGGDAAQASSRVLAKLEEARKRHAEVEAMLAADDAKLIAEALAAEPKNQELAAAVATEQRARGELEEAIKTLEAVGAPGRMTALTHQVLGACYRDAGELDEAAALLSPFVEERMTAFQQASRAYDDALRAKQDEVLQRLKAGTIPVSLQMKLDNAPSEEAGQELIRSYLRDEVDSDQQLKKLQEAFMEHQEVVPASMTLGMILLGQANEASGDARKKKLVEAERAFVAVRFAAEGQPSYHLGLGEVYHRLGRTEEGDKELDGLRQSGEPALVIEVASVYRSLGKVAKCREILEALYGSNIEVEHKQTAAYILSLVANSLVDKEKWLLRSDDSQLHVKASLLEVQGARAQERGDLLGADRAFAESARLWSSEETHSSAALNNTAVAYMARYGVTGKIEHLRTAADKFAAARQLRPDAALTAQNLMEALQQLALVELLSDTFDVTVLAPSQGEAFALVELLLEGKNADALRERLRRDPRLRQAQELAKQVQLLAPHRDAGYRAEKRRYLWLEDNEGLKGLHDRLARGQTIDIAETAERRREWEQKAKDDVLARGIEGAVTLSEGRLARAKATGKAPTIAIAEHLLADSLFTRDMLTNEDNDTALGHARAAYEAWPGPETADALTGALITLAIQRAGAGSPPLAEAYGKRRHQSLIILADDLASQNEAVKAALGGRPELAEALKLAAEHGLLDEGGYTYHAVARWADDAEAAAAAARYFDKPRGLIARKIEVLLYPGEAREAGDLAAYERASQAPR